MAKKSFNDYLLQDLSKTFMNENEFATEVISVDGELIQVIKDDDKLSDYNSNLSEGLIKCELLFFVPKNIFVKALFVGKQLIYKNKKYTIENLDEADGLYTIYLTGMSQ